jgi:hypothetical protein
MTSLLPALVVTALIGCQPSAPSQPRNDKKEATIVAGDDPVPFGYKCAWLAIKTDQPDAVVTTLGLVGAQKSNWAKGIAAAYNGDVFVTPVIQGWVLVVSLSIPEIVDEKREDQLTPLIRILGKRFRDVQYFGTHRVVEYHGWLRAVDGEIVRRYAYLGERGEALCNDGRLTDDEKKLGLVYDDSKFPSEQDVMKLAGAWSINPTMLNELNLGKGVGYLGSFPKK